MGAARIRTWYGFLEGEAPPLHADVSKYNWLSASGRSSPQRTHPLKMVYLRISPTVVPTPQIIPVEKMAWKMTTHPPFNGVRVKVTSRSR